MQIGAKIQKVQNRELKAITICHLLRYNTTLSGLHRLSNKGRTIVKVHISKDNGHVTC